MQWNCPQCGARYTLSDDLASKKVKCKKCGSTHTVTRSEPAPATVGAPPRPDEPKAVWWATIDGKQVGPLSTQVVQQAIANRELRPRDVLRPGKDSAPQPASSIAGFSSALSAAVQPPESSLQFFRRCATKFEYQDLGCLSAVLLVFGGLIGLLIGMITVFGMLGFKESSGSAILAGLASIVATALLVSPFYYWWFRRACAKLVKKEAVDRRNAVWNRQVEENRDAAAEADAAQKAQRAAKFAPLAVSLSPLLADLYTSEMWELLDRELPGDGALCRRNVSDGLEVSLPESANLLLIAGAASNPELLLHVEREFVTPKQRCLKSLGEILKDSLVAGFARSFAIRKYQHALQSGEQPKFNPNDAPDVHVNFLYGIAIRLFPTVDGDQALADLLVKEPQKLTDTIHDRLLNPKFVVAPQQISSRLANLKVPADCLV